MSGPVRVLLVDDHRMFVDLVQVLLDGEDGIDMVGAAGTAEEALELCAGSCPDVVLVDVDLPGMDGIEATRRIRDLCPAVRVVIVTAFQDWEVMARALEAGATAYVPKTHAADELIQVIRQAANGALVLPSGDLAAVSARVQTARRARPESERAASLLTGREVEVLSAIAEGRTTAEVAQFLHISPFTVQGHVKNILAKLGARTKLEAVTLALRAGIIELPGQGR